MLKMPRDPIEEIYKVYPQYKNNIEDFLFKSCEERWIVVLSKLPDTITNEEREGVADPRFASFRADKLEVVLIFNKFNPRKTVNKIINSIYEYARCEYRVGKTAEADNFDMNINEINSSGIHYYKNLEPAYYLDIHDYCKHKDWFDSGRIRCEYYFSKGEIDGIYRRWFDNGQLEVQKYFKNGMLNEEYLSYYENGQLDTRFHIINGELWGKYENWYETGQIKMIADYAFNKKYGEMKKWYIDGQIETEENYFLNVLSGLKRQWHENGQKANECTYKLGGIHGEYRSWFSNGVPNTFREYYYGTPVGYHTEWYPNGELKKIYNYNNDIFTALCYFWYKLNPKIKILMAFLFAMYYLIS